MAAASSFQSYNFSKSGPNFDLFSILWRNLIVATLHNNNFKKFVTFDKVIALRNVKNNRRVCDM
jgi:hypothetical protein